jgi:hypothetical protein
VPPDISPSYIHAQLIQLLGEEQGEAVFKQLKPVFRHIEENDIQIRLNK